MAEVHQIREWLRDQGYDVPTKGRIPGPMQHAYDAAHGNGNGTGPDYPDGMDDTAFADTGDGLDGELGDTGESTPRSTPRGPRGPRAAKRFFRGRAKPGRRKPRKPRVPVEDLIGAAWRLMASVARPVPPLHRTLRVQAPVAGALLEDAVRDTVVDVFLQPFARLQNGGKALAALLGPPMIVTALSVHLQRAALSGTPANALLLETGREALRESLMIWMDVAGPKFQQAMEREAEFEEKYGKRVDDFIDWLMSPPPDPGDAAAAQAEEEAIRRARGIAA